jgi:hypothetical protein
MDACNDRLKDARSHLHQAAQAMEERVIGRDAASHLRQAMRSILQAGIAAIDERDRRSGDRDKPSA